MIQSARVFTNISFIIYYSKYFREKTEKPFKGVAREKSGGRQWSWEEEGWGGVCFFTISYDYL